MRIDQGTLFVRSEGDAWFDRNQAALERFDPERDLVLRLIDLYELQPRRVLEIGASPGVRLASVAERYGAMVVAVEPSAAAVAFGRTRFPAVRFVRGRADAIGLGRPFDLVIVHYVFHWIDRAALLRSVAEIDRLVTDGGCLIIGDFHAPHPTMVPYHHLPDQDVYTFKQNYAAVFTASGLYHLVAAFQSDYASGRLMTDVPGDARGGVSLLRKTFTGEYVKEKRKTKNE